MHVMSTPFSSASERPEPGRYLLLPEESNATAVDASRPRVRRYRLTRLQGAPAAINPVRASRDFTHLRLAHD